MGQEEILKILEEKGSLTEREISEQLDISISSICHCLNRLIKANEVEREEIKLNHAYKHSYYIFKIKIVEKEVKK